jgi:hypothetical protein
MICVVCVCVCVCVRACVCVCVCGVGLASVRPKLCKQAGKRDISCATMWYRRLDGKLVHARVSPTRECKQNSVVRWTTDVHDDDGQQQEHRRAHQRRPWPHGYYHAITLDACTIDHHGANLGQATVAWSGRNALDASLDKLGSSFLCRGHELGAKFVRLHLARGVSYARLM